MSEELNEHNLGGSVQDNSREKSLHLLAIVLSFQQSRLSAERTLMAIIRTALSLFGFGFALYQFYRYLQNQDPKISHDTLPRDFGLALVLLGVATIIAGIIYHVRFIKQISTERKALRNKGFLPEADQFPVSSILFIAILLFIIILTAIVFMFSQIKLVP